MGVGVAGVANYTNTSSGTASNVVAYGGVGGPYEYCSFFSVLNWFAKGEPGAWYDPSDLTTLFQDSAGTLPAALEYPVGLMLDKSKNLALGAELVTNGDFSNGTTGWGTGNGAVLTVVNNEAVITNNGQGYGYINVSGSLATVAGKTYKFTVTYRQGTALANSIRISAISATGTEVGYFTFTSANQTITGYFTAVSTLTWFSILNGAGFTDVNYFDNISVKQIAGNHAFANPAAPANRPILSARVNLLTKTEDFSSTEWQKNGSSLGSNIAAPDGTLTGKLIIAGTLLGSHSISYGIVPSVASYTVSAYFKAGGYNYAALQLPFGSINAYAGFNLITGVVSLVGGGGTAAIVSVGDGWYKCSLTATTTSITGSGVAFRVENDGTLGNWSGNGTSGIYIWHPDLRPTNSGALLPPYQRVNTASDYDSVGFPLYLKCNGLQSAMSTNSIDFTSTDKMTVVTGVRKLGSTLQCYISFANASGGGNGLFNILTDVSAADNYYISSTGTTAGATTAKTFVPPLSNVLTSQIDFAQSGIAAENKFRANGSVPTLTYGGDSGTGNFSNYQLTLFYLQGAIPYNFNGQFYGAIIRGAQSDTASVTQTENYMAQKTGITF